MARKRIHEPLQALKAAVALGTQEALEAALGLWAEDPEIASNRALPPARVMHELLPAGRLLASEKVPRSFLEILSQHRLAAFRAMAAGAWALRLLRGEKAARGPLEALARDPRHEVREVIRLALEGADTGQDILQQLVQSWLEGRGLSPRVKALALRVLPALVRKGLAGSLALDMLENARLPAHPVVEEAWIQAVSELGSMAPEAVMHRFGRWLLARPRWAPWMARALARGWATRQPQQALHLLEAMAHRWGRRRWITQALQALERHRVLERPIEALWAEWLEETGVEDRDT